ncbi:hypothetical protein E4U57_007746 [Claviceps arundinis]|uniref:Uncharacterized protein n=1 Tax=Claviceps arundinis TaxID=1623583 RepID=A0ABQ7PGC6_9HYPO|nr:hypothetical protein E4U57_007746 [Claviceps arundinis]
MSKQYIQNGLLLPTGRINGSRCQVRLWSWVPAALLHVLDDQNTPSSWSASSFNTIRNPVQHISSQSGQWRYDTWTASAEDYYRQSRRKSPMDSDVMV